MPKVTIRERVVGEQQWGTGRGATLREAVGTSLVWLGVGLGLFLFFMAAANLWLIHEPVRGWSFYGRTVGLVVSLVAVWGVTGRLATHVWHGRGRGMRIFLVLLLALGIGAGAVALASTVQELPSEARLMEIGGRFTFGPYPDQATLQRLREEGFTAVVSILEPGSDPEEAGLLLREQVEAERLGLAVISVPPFTGQEMELGSLATLEQIAQDSRGRFYVHGLTEDSKRLALTRRLLLRLGNRRDLLPNELSDGLALERGPVSELAPDVHLTPFPTDAELLEYLAAGPVRNVVVLMDPANPEDQAWIDHEGQVLEMVGIELHVAPLHGERFDPEQAVEVSDLARSLERPVVLQTFLTPSVAGDAVRLAFTSGLPPLPPGVFGDTLSGGPVSVIAPHAATGPRPVDREFGWLFVRGVRKVALFDGLRPAERSRDRSLSDVAGLEWYFLDGDVDRLLEEMAHGGPWYVYGPGVETVLDRVTERFGLAFSQGNAGADDGTEHQQE
jgi:protein tyrosine phosphatase (PTP) superfamily phosphohydrolase (DUF442 family)